jgi:PBSX family phage terminase large subunit
MKNPLKDSYAIVKRSTLSLFDSNFSQQKAFCDDPARLKALWCTRRASKSYTAGLYMVKEALENPGVNCLFIGLTRLSAKGIVWKDILKPIDQKGRLHAEFNSTELTMTFSNGSVIWLTGADSDEDEMDKLLGKKYRLVCIDEASFYTINMQRLIYGILKPAVADNRGTICLMGTSSNFTKGLFYDITTGKEPGWSLHTWSAHDNPYVAKQWQEELDEIDTLRPLFKETPLYKQWYLNEWVIDTDKLVYKFNQDRNLFTNRPTHLKQTSWSYVLGVDLGFEDDSAFVVCAFHENDPILYIVKTHNAKGMDLTDVSNKIKELQSEYEIAKVIVDGANKQGVEEMQRRHGVALTPSEKQDKVTFIELLNAELIQARIKINQNCRNLINELMGLVWKTTGDVIDLPKKEHPALPNHLCDALLYAWRYCYSYMAEPAVKRPVMGTKAWQQQENDNIWEKEREKLEQEFKKTSEESF